MAFTVTTPGLFELRRDLKAIKAEGLGKDMAAGFRKAAKPLRSAIKTEATSTLPKRGGYNVIMGKSLRARQSVKENRLDALVAITIYSAGRKERRDIRRVDRGELRHPVYGRSRRLRRGVRAGTYIRRPWAVTNVPPGFVSRPIERLAPGVDKAGREVVDGLMKKLKG